MAGKSHARKIFEEQLRRIQEVTGKKTQVALAEYLGISQASVSSAICKGKIPAVWLVKLARAADVHPEWVLTGRGPHRICIPISDKAETKGESREGWSEKDVLRHLSSKSLADELVRRIALAQARSTPESDMELPRNVPALKN